MMTRRSRSLLGLCSGLLVAVACDDQPPPRNHCVDFLGCYAECRHELDLPLECGEMVEPGQPTTEDDHLRCFDRCNDLLANPLLTPGYFDPYGMENGGFFGDLALCLDGTIDEF